MNKSTREQVLEDALRKCHTLAESVSFALSVSQSIGSSPKSNTSIVGQVLTVLNELATIAKEAVEFKEPEPKISNTKVDFDLSSVKFRKIIEGDQDHKLGFWTHQKDSDGKEYIRAECKWCSNYFRVDEYGNVSVGNPCLMWQPYKPL
jgi:hypothetical protein